MLEMLKLAAKIALPVAPYDMDARNFWLGAVGIRSDNVVISSKNGAVQSSDSVDHEKIPMSHAENRCLRKMGKGGILYVSRVLRLTGDLAMARPCSMCRSYIRSHRIEFVYYTIDSDHFGRYDVANDSDKIYYQPSKFKFNISRNRTGSIVTIR